MKIIIFIIIAVIACLSLSCLSPNINQGTMWELVGSYPNSLGIQIKSISKSDELFVTFENKNKYFSKSVNGEQTEIIKLPENVDIPMFTDSPKNNKLGIYFEDEFSTISAQEYNLTANKLLSNLSITDYCVKEYLDNPKLFLNSDNEYCVLNFDTSDTLWVYNPQNCNLNKKISFSGNIIEVEQISDSVALCIVKSEKIINLYRVNLKTKNITQIINNQILNKHVASKENFKISQLNEKKAFIWYIDSATGQSNVYLFDMTNNSIDFSFEFFGQIQSATLKDNIVFISTCEQAKAFEVEGSQSNYSSIWVSNIYKSDISNFSK